MGCAPCTHHDATPVSGGVVEGFGEIERTFVCLFFFQAEDGIRDYKVTGVQTCALPISTALAQTFEPCEGKPGKDVVWVPTRPALAEKMLDLGGVTARDFVIDLGSGDGRLVIAAAKRGARALGVEYEADMVSLARRNAAAAGVAERAQFIQGDMFQADISKATLLALFLLPSNLTRLVPKFLDLPAGTRIGSKNYRIHGWGEGASAAN